WPGQRLCRPAALLSSLPDTKALVADKGYDADWLRAALVDPRIEACIPSKSNRKIQMPHGRVRCRKRHRIENMSGKLKDWRRIHTRYDRCAHLHVSHRHRNSHLLDMINGS
ncbi:MAG: hypothetical protein QM682_07425, partial [Paracoccus sp. (in: a-proteobacteria)]|uniref:transposase n=1 Tax=Paracoccus sp. TaxID=267 RepID=UPI0039E5082B